MVTAGSPAAIQQQSVVLPARTTPLLPQQINQPIPLVQQQFGTHAIGGRGQPITLPTHPTGPNPKAMPVKVTGPAATTQVS
jgi:hypothetical protein